MFISNNLLASQGLVEEEHIAHLSASCDGLVGSTQLIDKYVF